MAAASAAPFALAALAASRCAGRRAGRRAGDTFDPMPCWLSAGPYGIGTHATPYEYPTYEAAARQDLGGRCSAYCAQPPCAVWCQ